MHNNSLIAFGFIVFYVCSFLRGVYLFSLFRYMWFSVPIRVICYRRQHFAPHFGSVRIRYFLPKFICPPNPNKMISFPNFLQALEFVLDAREMLALSGSSEANHTDAKRCVWVCIGLSNLVWCNFIEIFLVFTFQFHLYQTFFFIFFVNSLLKLYMSSIFSIVCIVFETAVLIFLSMRKFFRFHRLSAMVGSSTALFNFVRPFHF